jgi:hypothetical protein
VVPGPPQAGQRVGLPAGAVLGAGEQSPQPLPRRVLPYQLFELCCGRAVVPCRAKFPEILEGGQPQFGEPQCFGRQ